MRESYSENWRPKAKLTVISDQTPQRTWWWQIRMSASGFITSLLNCMKHLDAMLLDLEEKQNSKKDVNYEIDILKHSEFQKMSMIFELCTVLMKTRCKMIF
ncbi:hypothetical protein CsSME_00031515 [Camellia sinensis var. sinensis]